MRNPAATAPRRLELPAVVDGILRSLDQPDALLCGAAIALLAACGGEDGGGDKASSTPYANLPDISTFETGRSDRFIVDITDIDAGHPFKGARANIPHQGAHVDWDNSSDKWPKGGTEPANYPPIYAFSDGYIDSIDYSFPVGSNDRYGISIAFAKDASSTYVFAYGIEPLIPEPEPDFYRRFILVSERQKVKKGDVIGYMYLPPGSGIGTHIHFHVQQLTRNNFLAPAVFTSDVVDSFSARWGAGVLDGATVMPSCMGYMLSASENPFSGTAVDVLK